MRYIKKWPSLKVAKTNSKFPAENSLFHLINNVKNNFPKLLFTMKIHCGRKPANRSNYSRLL